MTTFVRASRCTLPLCDAISTALRRRVGNAIAVARRGEPLPIRHPKRAEQAMTVGLARKLELYSGHARVRACACAGVFVHPSSVYVYVCNDGDLHCVSQEMRTTTNSNDQQTTCSGAEVTTSHHQPRMKKAHARPPSAAHC